VIARGRDATDVAMVNSFGLHGLRRFEVITEEVEEAMPAGPVPAVNGHWSPQPSLS
jgi:hypothetical protein